MISRILGDFGNQKILAFRIFGVFKRFVAMRFGLGILYLRRQNSL